MQRGRPRHDDILTPREWQVLDLLREGLTNEQIASRLGVSHDTAKFHVSEILGKLGVESRREAAVWQPDAAPATRRLAPALVPPFGLRLEGAWRALAAGVIGVAALTLGLLAAGVFITGNRVDDSLGKIAFLSDGDIWVRTLPEGTPWRLTNTGDASMPRWSPSGEWLLYNEGLTPWGTVWLISADGSTRHELGEGWSGWAQGDKILDDKILHARDGIVLMSDVPGDNETALLWPYPDITDGVLMGIFPIDDGRWLALGLPQGVSQDLDDRDSSAWDGVDSYWKVSGDGSDPELLVRIEGELLQRLLLSGLSPDGRYLLFWDSHVENFYDGFPTYAAPVGGGELKRLPVKNSFSSTQGSPLGANLVRSDGDGGESWTDRRVGILDLDAASFTPLTPSDLAAISPAVSPDDSLIAYVAAPDLGPDASDDALRQRRIWLMDADGSNQRPVTGGSGFRDEVPRWSADGSHLLFARISGEDFCDTPQYDLMLYSLENDSVELVEAGLPLFGTRNELPVVGQVPECESDPGPTTTDFLGVLNLGPVLDWWQPRP